MGSLRSALDELAVEDLRRLGDDELAEHVAEIERASRVLEVARSRAIAEVEERRSFAPDGCAWTATWIPRRGRPC
jgi:hypothetical protein